MDDDLLPDDPAEEPSESEDQETMVVEALRRWRYIINGMD